MYLCVCNRKDEDNNTGFNALWAISPATRIGQHHEIFLKMTEILKY